MWYLPAAFALLLLPFARPSQAQPAPPTSITFVIDMRGALQDGTFDPARDVVGVRGARPPLSWQQTLRAGDSNGDGLYEATVLLEAAPGSLVQYKFKIDGTAGPDAGWETGRNRQFVVGGDTTITRAFDAPPEEIVPTFSGDIELHEAFPSDFLPPRDVFVYLPPGYRDQPERRYPVLYLHDGRNVFDASEVGAEWHVDEAAEHLIRAGAIEPLIIVGVHNTAHRTDEYTPTERTWHHEARRSANDGDASGPMARFAGTFRTESGEEIVFSLDGEQLFALIPGGSSPSQLDRLGPDQFRLTGMSITFTFSEERDGLAHHVAADKPAEGGQGDLYGRFLVEELKLFVDDNYRTLPNAANTGLGGSSFGGLISLHLGLRHADVFGRLAVLSPAVWWDDSVLLTSIDMLKEKSPQRIWVDMGTGEGEQMLSGARQLRDALIAKGWILDEDLRYVEAEGAPHHETAWAERMPDVLRFLYPAR